ncbi:hypothetical protein FBUS_02223 [Fasciolopsis buskii]|uniref:Uncharacterized protein n=1 Tax=Fasciolopsis buskii TaxID=27845 RepID=A0A8E0RS09_9TREM|nr:hypothetical protein FBUS_02223 [Fasciolopsis buski]
MDSYLDFPLFAEKVATFMDHLEDVNEITFIVIVTGQVVATMDETQSTRNNTCEMKREIQRSICDQMDHSFYRFDVRVNNPFYLQCVIRHLSNDQQFVDIEIWLAKPFVRNHCAQDPDQCAVRFVRNIVRNPPDDLPNLPFRLDSVARDVQLKG